MLAERGTTPAEWLKRLRRANKRSKAGYHGKSSPDRRFKRELERMQAEAKNPAKMVHVNKRRLQSYSEFIQGYKEYKQAKKSSSYSLDKH